MTFQMEHYHLKKVRVNASSYPYSQVDSQGIKYWNFLDEIKNTRKLEIKNIYFLSKIQNVETIKIDWIQPLKNQMFSDWKKKHNKWS